MVAVPRGRREELLVCLWQSQEVPAASAGGSAVRGLLSSPGPNQASLRAGVSVAPRVLWVEGRAFVWEVDVKPHLAAPLKTSWGWLGFGGAQTPHHVCVGPCRGRSA